VRGADRYKSCRWSSLVSGGLVAVGVGRVAVAREAVLCLYPACIVPAPSSLTDWLPGRYSAACMDGWLLRLAPFSVHSACPGSIRAGFEPGRVRHTESTKLNLPATSVSGHATAAAPAVTLWHLSVRPSVRLSESVCNPASAHLQRQDWALPPSTDASLTFIRRCVASTAQSMTKLMSFLCEYSL